MTLQTVLLVNLSLAEFDSRDAHYASELAIVVAASLANHLVGLRQEISLITNGRDPIADAPAAGLAMGKGRGQLMGVLELLGRVEARAAGDFCHFLRDQRARLPWGATLVILTAKETDDFWETLLGLRQAGFSVVVVFCDYPSRQLYERAAERGASLGFACRRIWKEEDADVWRRRALV